MNPRQFEKLVCEHLLNRIEALFAESYPIRKKFCFLNNKAYTCAVMCGKCDFVHKKRTKYVINDYSERYY